MSRRPGTAARLAAACLAAARLAAGRLAAGRLAAVRLAAGRLAAAGLGLAAATVGLGVAVGATPAAGATVGYVRLAHLSPDTPAVDVYLSVVSGGAPPQKFPAVGYGVVSKYQAMAPGTYSVAMRNVGAADSTPPVLSTQLTVTAGAAYTVAGVGRFADLGLRVIDDDLSLPSPGMAKVRVVHASVRAPLLDVSVADGTPIADGIAFATTTGYREIKPGSWQLRLRPSGSGPATDLAATCAAGGVYSVLILDGKDGGLTVEVRTDARAGESVPRGGVDTGAGGTAPNGPRAPDSGAGPAAVALPLAAVAALLLAAVAALLLAAVAALLLSASGRRLRPLVGR